MAAGPPRIAFEAIPIRDRKSLTDAFRARRHSLGISQLEVDDIAGLPDGYTAKIETQNATGRSSRAIGWDSFPLYLGALKIDLFAAPRAVRTTGEKDGDGSSLSSSHDEFMRERGRRLAKARWAKATAQQRKAAVTRMNRARLRKRLAKQARCDRPARRAPRHPSNT